MKMNKMLFFSTMVMGTMLAISSSSWFSMWMGLEINLLSVIPLMTTKSNISSEASMKYLIIQSMTSMILLFSMIVLMLKEEFLPFNETMMAVVMQLALITKLGAAPLHFWFPEVMKGLTWMNALIMMTWQKIAPSAIIMMINPIKQIMIVAIMSSLMISTIMAMTQTDLRAIMSYSSINHLAWILAAMMASSSIWLIYMSVYSMINMTLAMTFNNWKVSTINQMMFNMNMDKTNKMTIMINFMSLGGLPPMIGFFPKWLTINWLSENSMMELATMMIITTLIMLFVYIRMMMTSLTISSQQMKPKTNVLTHWTFLMNFVSISSLPICTALFNLT